MCLKVIINKPTDLQLKIANKDITCYKTMHIYTNSNADNSFINSNHLYSYYQAFLYDRGKRYTLKLRDMTEEDIYSTTDGSFVEIYKGFHSYVKGIDVIDQLNRLDHNTTIGIKCIIPKDSSYYKGDFNNVESYVSDTIIIGKRIFKNQY